ncbi:MAG: hypothetical protein AB7P07_09585 [Hyphomonadaceae bacterium]
MLRSLGILTTTAAVALLGVANAQTAEQQPDAAAASAGSGMRDAVSAYAAYQNDVSELRANTIRSDADLEVALDRVARHNRDALTRGWVSYGAYTAAQSRGFVQGVRDAAQYYGRDAVIWAVTADPAYSRTLRGGNEATRMLLDSASADAQRIVNVADQYRELAYALQRQRWANAVAPRQADRVQRIRSLGAPGAPVVALPAEVSPRLSVAVLSLTPASEPTHFGGRRFWDGLRGGDEVVEVSSTPVTYQWRVNATRGMALDRMTALAALQALDATETHQSAVSQLMHDQRSRDCLEMAQLQLYQCMSAARFRYENAFCLGQHGLRDIGLCIGAVAQPDSSAAALPAAAAGAAALGGRN